METAKSVIWVRSYSIDQNHLWGIFPLKTIREQSESSGASFMWRDRIFLPEFQPAAWLQIVRSLPEFYPLNLELLRFTRPLRVFVPLPYMSRVYSYVAHTQPI